MVAKDGCFICFNCGHKSRAGTLYSRRKSRIYRVNHPACDIIFYIIHTHTLSPPTQCSRGSAGRRFIFTAGIVSQADFNFAQVRWQTRPTWERVRDLISTCIRLMLTGWIIHHPLCIYRDRLQNIVLVKFQKKLLI